MSEEKMPAVADNTEQALVVAGDHGGFTEQEAVDGMPPVVQSYVKSYPFFLRSDNGTFELRDNRKEDKDSVVWTGPAIDSAVLYLGHHTKTLRLGDVRGLETDSDTWSDEDKELVALSYDARSKGNFEINGYGDYLRKPLWDKVGTRLYVFGIFKNLPSGLNPVACSFGITADSIKKPGSFSNLRLQIERIRLGNGEPANFPLQYLVCELHHTPDKDATGKKSYQRVAFGLAKKDGKIMTAFDSKEQYLKDPRGLEMFRKIKKTHDAAVEYAESGSMPMSNGVQKPVNHAASPDSEFKDDVPF